MDAAAYCRALNCDLPIDGGQELILAEIFAALSPYTTIWVPFSYQGGSLIGRLRALGIQVRSSSPEQYTAPAGTKAVYFGTPTIVNDRSLFPHPDTWTKEKERALVRAIVRDCSRLGYRRIISGLGSGDISPEERIADMGGGMIVCEKHFGDFTDWVLVRDLHG